MQVHGVRTACALHVHCMCTACALCCVCTICPTGGALHVCRHLAANPHLEVYNRQERPPPPPSCPPDPPS